MKSSFFRRSNICFSLLSCLLLCFIVHSVFSLTRPYRDDFNIRAIDFHLRYNEATCVRNGQDPFLIWNGTKTSSEYIPLGLDIHTVAIKSKLLHAYPPWEYVWMLPFTFFDATFGEMVFESLNWCALIIMVLVAYIIGVRLHRGVLWPALVCAASILSVPEAIRCCMFAQNYGIIIAFSILMAILCHRDGRPMLAGIFWAITLIKPQLGTLFIVALLFHREWKSIGVALGITVFGTLFVSYLTDRAPLDLVLSVCQYSQGQFKETGLVPQMLYSLLVPSTGHTIIAMGSAFVGLLLCVFLLRYLRNNPDPFEWTMPAVFFCTIWTTSRSHDQVVYVVMILALALSAMKRTCLKWSIMDVILIILLLLRSVDDVMYFPVKIFQWVAFILLYIRIVKFNTSCDRVPVPDNDRERSSP